MKKIINFLLLILQNFVNFFEAKMNPKYRKLFSSIGAIWGMLFFFVMDIPSQVIKYSILNSDNISVHEAGLKISQSLFYGLGLFIFYTAIGATLFIVIGEIFIRICEYFNIHSKLYTYMVKIKDSTTMNSVNYYEKYKGDEK